jgi:hypothetical protein
MKPTPAPASRATKSLAASIIEAFPYARYHEDWKLVTWHPVGILDDDQADRVVEFLESEERIGGESFDRYTDMSGLSRIQLNLDHVFTLAKRRRRGYKGRAVRSAFYAVRLISLSIAKMYQELMQGAPIEVGVFRDRAAAAEWLGVPLGVLAAPAPSEA